MWPLFPSHCGLSGFIPVPGAQIMPPFHFSNLMKYAWRFSYEPWIFWGGGLRFGGIEHFRPGGCLIDGCWSRFDMLLLRGGIEIFHCKETVPCLNVFFIPQEQRSLIIWYFYKVEVFFRLTLGFCHFFIFVWLSIKGPVTVRKWKRSPLLWNNFCGKLSNCVMKHLKCISQNYFMTCLNFFEGHQCRI